MKTILQNWHFMRVLRVVLAIAVLVQSWYAKDSTTAIIGIMLLALGIFNIGCCGPTGCYTTPSKKNTVSTKESVYEEIL